MLNADVTEVITWFPERTGTCIDLKGKQDLQHIKGLEFDHIYIDIYGRHDIYK